MLIGGSGADLLSSSGSNTLQYVNRRRSGNMHTLTTSGVYDTLIGGSGADQTLTTSGSGDVLIGGAGNPLLVERGTYNVLEGVGTGAVMLSTTWGR